MGNASAISLDGISRRPTRLPLDTSNRKPGSDPELAARSNPGRMRTTSESSYYSSDMASTCKPALSTVRPMKSTWPSPERRNPGRKVKYRGIGDIASPHLIGLGFAPSSAAEALGMRGRFPSRT
jgi:hypothetical protein